jgi:hypothetical protein
MATDEDQEPRDARILASLSEKQRGELERKQYVKVEDDLVWIEPEGAVRKEKAASLYYIRTNRGVFRISRISEEVVEV